MLVTDGLPPTPANIQRCLQTLWSIRDETLSVSLFADRRIVVGAGSECLNDIDTETRPPRDVMGIATRLHGDYHRFGSRKMLDRLREETNEQVTLIRANPSVRDRIHSILHCQSDHLPALSIPVGDRTDRQKEGIAILAANVRQALGLAANASIHMTFTTAAGGERGTFRVFVGNSETPLYSAETSMKDGHVESVISTSSYTIPESAAPLTPQTSRERLLAAIRTTPPGEAGFCFIFTGHGLPRGIYLDGGAAGGSAHISPEEMASAIVARRERFGEKTNSDIYMFLTCHSHEYAREVNRLLESTAAAPYMYSATEFGQVSVESIGRDISGPDFDAILARCQQMRKDGYGFTVGNLLDVMMQRSGRNTPNPSLFAPPRRQGEERRRYYQISGDTVRLDSERG